MCYSNTHTHTHSFKLGRQDLAFNIMGTIICSINIKTVEMTLAKHSSTPLRKENETNFKTQV